MLMLVILVLGAATVLVSSLNSSRLKMERDKITADALAQAKEALIGYAVKVELNKLDTANQPRPGDLPCPDIDNDGDTGGACGSATNVSIGQDSRLGRLPWKSLRLPDLRDGSGERLWYAVSNNFKHNVRTDKLNSDTPGTITIRNSDGSLLYDASGGNGVAAVVIAPGTVLQRTGETLPQNRTDTGTNIASNYLDSAYGEDNSNFIDGNSNGFIQGSIKDNNDNIILNDSLITITREDIMHAVQLRVANEVKNCLMEYAAANNSRYPWAVQLDDLPDYDDNQGELFGRIPDNLNKTSNGTTMADKWGIKCNTHDQTTASSWWKNWQELTFYALADAYKPSSNTSPSCGTCISVNPPSPTADKKFVVIVAGEKLATQNREDDHRKDEINYLEGENAVTPVSFEKKSSSTPFNDVVVFE